MVFSVLAFCALVTSICIKERKKSLFVQSLDCLFEAIYAYIIMAYTGVVLNIINFIRSMLFIGKQKIAKALYTALLVTFESVIVINCIFTWNGPISLLPTLGSMFRTYCLWQSDMKLVRISGIIAGLTYGLYYTYYQGWFMVLGYTILGLTAIYNVIRRDYGIRIRIVLEN